MVAPRYCYIIAHNRVNLVYMAFICTILEMWWQYLPVLNEVLFFKFGI
jgi:hypothetical protein